ncbi:MAG: SH3 domain-containing protein [Deltaproteobacteria bacterium]|nr:SH3 domain-containing protein [Deltaproteobacteria bacterium]
MLKVTATSLNIRRGPGKRFPVEGQLSQGELIEPLDTAGWLPVELEDGTVGWVSADFLAEEPAPSPDEFDFSTKAGTVEAIKEECRKQGLGLPAQIAYVLATVEWETGGTFRPVREAYWKSEEWRRRNLRYYPYYGRGYVQLTWKENYRKYSEILGVDLVSEPDLALEPETALFILAHGFRTGAFTGKKLTDYVNEEKTDFLNARPCINALDRAGEIATLAEGWLRRLTAV